MEMNIIDFSDFKSEKFEKIFREYYLEEGIKLREDTIVFNEIQKSSDEGKTKCFCFVENEEIKAFVMYKIMELANENGFIKHYVGHIEELYVVSEKRMQGIAKMLLNKVEEYMREKDVKKLFLTSREHMYDFYKKMEFYIDESYICANKLKCLFKSL